MATISISYAADEAIVSTNLDALASSGWVSLPSVTNAVNKYVDGLVGGQIHFDTATGTILAGDSVDIYISALTDSDTSTTGSGGIDLLFAAGDITLTLDTEFTPLNMKLIAVVKPEATAPDTEQTYNWGPVSVAAAFGGLMPEIWFLTVHNNSTDAVLDAGENVFLNAAKFFRIESGIQDNVGKEIEAFGQIWFQGRERHGAGVDG